jgi:hypothetical protein
VADPGHPADAAPRGPTRFGLIRLDLAEGSDIESKAPPYPTARTHKLVARELAMLRRERDDHIANGRFRLAGECCADLEQLTREYVAIRT